MRPLPISVAVLALVATSAFAQPGHEHEHGPGGGPGQGGHEHGGPGPDRGRPSATPQAPPQEQMRAPAAPHGGPTNFTNQIQGHQPDQGQQREGTWSRDPNRPMRGQPPNLQQDRGGGRDRGEQGPQAAPQLQAAPQQMQRGPNRAEGRPDFGYRGDNGRDFRGDRDAGRPGNPTFGGPRRDFSGFRDFHRDFRSARRFHIAPYRPPAGFYPHRWSFGEFLPRPYWGRDYWLLDFDAYGLPPPPYGAVWVRVGADALLIDEYSGEIITVAYDVFY